MSNVRTLLKETALGKYTFGLRIHLLILLHCTQLLVTEFITSLNLDKMSESEFLKAKSTVLSSLSAVGWPNTECNLEADLFGSRSKSSAVIKISSKELQNI